MADPALTSGDPLGETDPPDAPAPPPPEEEQATGLKGLLERRKGLIALLVGAYAAWKALRWAVTGLWSVRGVDEAGPFLWDHRLLIVAGLVAVFVAAVVATRFVIPRVSRRL